VKINKKEMFPYLIWSCVPPEVAFEIAQAASFLMSNSAVCRRCTRGAIMFALITACNRTMVFYNTNQQGMEHFAERDSLQKMFDLLKKSTHACTGLKRSNLSTELQRIQT
jgi:hypothetical protein